MFLYKIDILKELKEKKISTYYIRKNKIFSEGTLQKFRQKDTNLSIDVLDSVCELLNCQLSDILEYVPDNQDSNKE